MKITQHFLTKNNCYKNGKTHKVRGIMVHSTGANNPTLKRYVGPDDGKLGKNRYNNHWNQPKPDGQSKCVHAFIGKLENGQIATYQTLPWTMRGWHSGSGRLGASKNANNNGYIGFEICEDDLSDRKYFNAVYEEAVNLCVYLCNKFGLTEKDIIDHSEGHKLGIASNHGDVRHWFSRHGKTISDFRSDVKKKLEGGLTMDQYNKLKSEIAELRSQLNEKANKINHSEVAPWAKEAVDWAVKEEILKGDGNGLNLSGTLTRQEQIVILHRYHKKFIEKK